MITHRTSAVWRPTSQFDHSVVHHVYKRYIPKLRSYNLPLVSQAQGYYSIVTQGKSIAKHMMNPRISADLSMTMPIGPFSCAPGVQEIHIKAEVLHLTPGLLSLGYYSIVTHRKCIVKHMINPRISADRCMTKPIETLLCTQGVQEVHTKAEVAHLTPGLLGLAYYSFFSSFFL